MLSKFKSNKLCRNYVATKNGLQANDIELLVLKEGRYNITPFNFSTVLADELSEPVVINPLTDPLQLLEDQQIMSDVAKIYGQSHLDGNEGCNSDEYQEKTVAAKTHSKFGRLLEKSRYFTKKISKVVFQSLWRVVGIAVAGFRFGNAIGLTLEGISVQQFVSNISHKGIHVEVVSTYFGGSFISKASKVFEIRDKKKSQREW
ncbi:hypothetical protein L1987_34473 [Smallanthus sonchifolius]|uniref:Uncharacterized protein n=1 Tax=Smallanthus sonchifolius TaxID=185202 RepID=A0ACB9HUT1_9ASTR|nr:hypothetical protein L1987_34473 [Smallanthus sonchifolius]